MPERAGNIRRRAKGSGSAPPRTPSETGCSHRRVPTQVTHIVNHRTHPTGTRAAARDRRRWAPAGTTKSGASGHRGPLVHRHCGRSAKVGLVHVSPRQPLAGAICDPPLEHFLPNLNRSAGGHLAQGRGFRRRSMWCIGRAGTRRIWAKCTRPEGFPAGGRPRRRTDLAVLPVRPAPSSWRIASPSEKQSDPDLAGNALAICACHRFRMYMKPNHPRNGMKRRSLRLGAASRSRNGTSHDTYPT